MYSAKLLWNLKFYLWRCTTIVLPSQRNTSTTYKIKFSWQCSWVYVFSYQIKFTKIININDIYGIVIIYFVFNNEKGM